MGFVKTAKKPDDLVVRCVLLRAYLLAPGGFQLRSDGEWAELWGCMGGCGWGGRFGVGWNGSYERLLEMARARRRLEGEARKMERVMVLGVGCC